MDVMSIGFKSEADVDLFLDIACLREYGLRSVGDRIYLDIYTCDEVAICDNIAEFILKFYAKSSVENYIDKVYGYFTACEKKIITDAAVSDSFAENVRPELSRTVYKCIKVNRIIDMEGFVSFRMKWFADVLCRRADVIAEDIIDKREYEELVELLRHILKGKAKNGEVILEFTPDVYRISDCNGNEPDFPEYGRSSAANDFLVGFLAKIAPEKIVIRGSEYCEDTLMAVIKDVFEDAVFTE